MLASKCRVFTVARSNQHYFQEEVYSLAQTIIDGSQQKVQNSIPFHPSVSCGDGSTALNDCCRHHRRARNELRDRTAAEQQPFTISRGWMSHWHALNAKPK